MSDRHPYSIMPNFNPALLSQQQTQQGMQHQQLQQQSQGSLQDGHQPMSGFPDSAPRNNIWPHMQQQHVQNQLRPQGGMDVNNPPGNQMADIFRNQQNALRMQRAQQANFGLGGMQQQGMGTGTLGGQQFHDQSNPGQPPALTHNPSLSSQSLANRNAMLQTLQSTQNHPGTSAYRQLELMNLAQNQQNQNGPVHFGIRMAQPPNVPGNVNPQGMSQQSHSDIFSNGMNNEALRRPSPSNQASLHPNGQIMMQQQQSMSQPQQPPQQSQTRHIDQTLMAKMGPIMAHHRELTSQISAAEAALETLANQRMSIADHIYQTRYKTITNEIQNKKEQVQKMMQMAHSIQAANHAGGGMSVQANQTMPTGNVGPSAQNSNWMAAMSQQSQQFANNSGLNQQMPAHSTTPNNHQPNLQLAQQALSPNAMPNRNGPTPHINPLFQNQTSPNLTPQLPFQGNGIQAGGPNNGMNGGPMGGMNGMNRMFPPALEKTKFDTTYNTWCKSHNIATHGQLTVENREIDLHMLHSLVNQEGGAMKITQQDRWPVVAGRMGFVHFPGTDSEPAKSGPGSAQAIANVYKTLLLAYDEYYAKSFNDMQAKKNPLNGNSPSPMMVDTRQMALIMSYADIPSETLRAQGIAEKIIQFVDANRANLLKSASDPNYPNQLRTTPSQRPGSQVHPGNPGMINGQPGSLQPNQPQGQVQNPMVPNRAQYMQQQQQQQQQQQANRPMQPSNIISGMGREQLAHASNAVSQIKAEAQRSGSIGGRMTDVPSEQRQEYSTLFEKAIRTVMDIDPKLPMYALLLNDNERLRRLIHSVLTIQHQRHLQMSSGIPRFVADLNQLRTILKEIENTQIIFAQRFNNARNQQIQHIQGSQVPPGPNVSLPPAPGVLQSHPQMPNQFPPMNKVAPPIHPQQAPNRTVTLRPPPPGHPKKPVPSAPTPSANATSPTPSANAPTPVNNASTPTAVASPQTPKSPKAPAKKKPKARRVSKATPVSEAITASAPTSTTTAPSPSAGVKRPREEESAPTPSGSGSPPTTSGEPSPPKRAKTEWDSPLTVGEAIQRKEDEIERLESSEDASAFLQRMHELMKTDPANMESVSETLEKILQGYGSAPGAPEAPGSVLPFGDSSSVADDLPIPEEFQQFFDFSSFGTNEEEDTATPDLVPSSTNPSPESGSEHGDLGLKVEDSYSDPLRLGALKEIDGGESAFYQTNEWKWDGQMNAMDQPWAIYNP